MIDPSQEFNDLADQGQFPRGFINTRPGSGHLNKYGHEVVADLLVKKIEEILK